MLINPFVPNALFLYPLKTSETVRLFDVFRGYRKGTLGTNGLISTINSLLFRLLLRSPLVRLFAEVETFRFRAIQDTQITVDKMEQARSDYRARLLWMADISKELDPDHNKRLDKYRDVSIIRFSWDNLKHPLIIFLNEASLFSYTFINHIVSLRHFKLMFQFYAS